MQMLTEHRLLIEFTHENKQDKLNNFKKSGYNNKSYTPFERHMTRTKEINLR